MHRAGGLDSLPQPPSAASASGCVGRDAPRWRRRQLPRERSARDHAHRRAPRPSHCASVARAICSACSAWMSWIRASASSACARESSAPGRSCVLDQRRDGSRKTLLPVRHSRGPREPSLARPPSAGTRRRFDAHLEPGEVRASGRACTGVRASPPTRLAPRSRTPPTRARHRPRCPRSMKHEASVATGPEMPGTVVPGSSSPATLLRVARLICSDESSRGR